MRHYRFSVYFPLHFGKMIIETRLLLTGLVFCSSTLASVIGTAIVTGPNLTEAFILPTTTPSPPPQPQHLRADDNYNYYIISTEKDSETATKSKTEVIPVKIVAPTPTPEQGPLPPIRCKEGEGECEGKSPPIVQNTHPGCLEISVKRYHEFTGRVWVVRVRENGKKLCDVKRECGSCVGGEKKCYRNNTVKWASNMVWYYSAMEDKQYFAKLYPAIDDPKHQCGKFAVPSVVGPQQPANSLVGKFSGCTPWSISTGKNCTPEHDIPPEEKSQLF